MAIIDCPSCGQRATGKATRCPECGLIFTPGIRQQSITRPGLRMLRRVALVVAATAVLALAVITFLGRDEPGEVTVPRVATGLEPEPEADDTAGSAPAPAQAAQTVPAPPPATQPTPTPPAQTQAPTPTPTPTPAAPRDTTPSLDVAAAIEPPPDTAPQVVVDDGAPSVAPALPPDTTPAIAAQPEPPPVATGDSVPTAATPSSGPLQRYARTWVSIREARSDGAPAIRTLEPGEAVLVDSLSRGWYRVVVRGSAVGYVDGGYLDEVQP